MNDFTGYLTVSNRGMAARRMMLVKTGQRLGEDEGEQGVDEIAIVEPALDGPQASAA